MAGASVLGVALGIGPQAFREASHAEKIPLSKFKQVSSEHDASDAGREVTQAGAERTIIGLDEVLGSGFQDNAKKEASPPALSKNDLFREFKQIRARNDNQPVSNRAASDSTEGAFATRWGMSQAQVRAILPAVVRLPAPVQEGVGEQVSVLGLQTQVFGESARAVFELDRDKLFMQMVFFERVYPDQALAARRFERVKSRLVVEHGQASGKGLTQRAGDQKGLTSFLR